MWLALSRRGLPLSGYLIACQAPKEEGGDKESGGVISEPPQAGKEVQETVPDRAEAQEPVSPVSPPPWQCRWGLVSL